MQDRVHLAGTIDLDELPAYYRAADAYVNVSLSDGSSLSLLEAMACGVPAIVTDIPGNREWVLPGGNGCLFPVGQSQTLVDAVTAAFEGLERRNRSIAEDRANWDCNFLHLLDACQMAAELRGKL